METVKSQPGRLAAGRAVVLFDGTCKLCNGWATFIIQQDKERRLTLSAVQSSEGQALLKWAGLPQDAFNTIVLVEDDRFYVRSDAMFRIIAHLPARWHWLLLGRVFPKVIRDWLYDRIALNRYRIFGRYDACRLPPADHAERFLTRDALK
jgi:predicted DCC family thiol-disulfide oxidoreductase YuxK